MTLYTSTDDDCIKTDLDAGESSSLIFFGRLNGTRSDTEDSNHSNLAIGAFRKHAGDRGYEITGFEEILDQIPRGLTEFWIGGPLAVGAPFAVTVYEQR